MSTVAAGLEGREGTAAEYAIRSGDYAAVVTARGGALRKLTHRGRDLVVPAPEERPLTDFRGIIAAPWPNRIADGFYRFDGKYLHVPVNEPHRACALHGLVFANDWALIEVDERAAAFELQLEPTRGYPFALRLEATYSLDSGGPRGGEGLTWEVRAENIGASTAPYGVCPHPYLRAGDSPLDSWELEIPADRFLEVTPDRLLPVRERDVEAHEFDFRQPRRIGATKIDHAFAGIHFDLIGTATMRLHDPQNATGVAMAWDSACPWVQIHTADKCPPGPESRLGLAVEPMTCPPDAFNSGRDIVRLEPGATHTARWRIHSIN
jgi:aldose 1-epimerase